MRAERVDTLVAGLASVRDAELLAEARSPHASRLLHRILEQPVRERPTERRRSSRTFVAIAVLALAVALSAAALGGPRQIRSWLSGVHGPESPSPAGADVVVASGVSGVPWRIVATPTDQGLCLFLVTGETTGVGSCGYSDIRGALPAELRGDPSARCLATPSTAVPCGSLPRHWVDAVSGSDTADPRFTRRVVFAALAEGVARVDLVLANDEVERARLVRPPEMPLAFYWAELPPGQLVTMVIARDSSGRVLERRVQPWNGNPTGDPRGPRAPRAA